MTIFVCAMLMATGMVAVVASQAKAQSSTSGGTFILGTAENEVISNQNPLTASGLSGDVLGITYSDTLLYEFSNGSVIPWLAQSWNVTNGGKTITFNLVHNASWVNGTTVAAPLTAQDVVYTFHVIMANSTLDFNNIDPYLANVSAPNQYTVVFQLTTPTVMMFYYLGGQTIIPYAWHTYVSNISGIGNYFNMNIGHQLSCGPMVLQSISGANINLVANPYFFKGKPHFSKEVIVLFKSSTSMIEALEAGEIDATYVDPSNLFTQLNATPGIKAVAYKDTFSLVLWFDLQVAPFNNTFFRKGLASAINKTEILYKAEDGLGGQASFGGLPWTQSTFYNTSVPYYGYNLTVANNYFKEAGLHIGSNGFWQYANNTTVNVNFVEIPISDWTTAMSIMQQQLAADNFEVTYNIVPVQTWVTEVFINPSFNFASYFNYGPLFGNPWYDLWAAFDGQGYWNFEHYNNTTVNNLLSQANLEVTNQAALNATLQKVQGIIANQVPIIPIMGAKVYYAYRPGSVGGFYPNQQLISPLDSLYAHVATNSSSPSTPSGSSISPLVLGAIGIAVGVLIVAAAAVIYIRRKKE